LDFLSFSNSQGTVISYPAMQQNRYRTRTRKKPAYQPVQEIFAMIVTNIETVPSQTIVKHFGLVSGSTELLSESREEAVQRMIEQARAIGANAIVNVRFSTSSVAAGAAELYAYGTAVVVE
jgi:uncharacterized protein YbjQ (UPF0145 family)